MQVAFSSERIINQINWTKTWKVRLWLENISNEFFYILSEINVKILNFFRDGQSSRFRKQQALWIYVEHSLEFRSPTQDFPFD